MAATAGIEKEVRIPIVERTVFDNVHVVSIDTADAENQGLPGCEFEAYAVLFECLWPQPGIDGGGIRTKVHRAHFGTCRCRRHDLAVGPDTRNNVGGAWCAVGIDVKVLVGLA